MKRPDKGQAGDTERVNDVGQLGTSLQSRYAKLRIGLKMPINRINSRMDAVRG